MQLINHPHEFKTGYRIIMRCRRNKDGAGNSGGDRSSKKIITNGPEAWEAGVEKLAADFEEGERIYATVDERDFDKGIREFKRRQLDADYSDDGSRHGFYIDGNNRLVSCLQGPGARVSRLFLFDCDSNQEYNRLLRQLGYRVTHSYPTKNGGHIITDPFEYPKLLAPEFHPLIQKNAMLLVAY